MNTAVREQPVQSSETEPLRNPSHWLRRAAISVLLLIAIIWSGDAGISFLVQHTRLRSGLTARLEAAFGRPVEVGSYAFSIWGGPVLEAHSVRIGEDPRFGNEYFIRADSISVGLRWWGLLRGHVELGSLSVSGASLNLVRAPDGDWNLAEWLPRPPAAGFSAPGSAPVASQPAVQFRRIDIANSRIDFKRGYEKLTFALVDVNGSMETDAPGRWRINMTASPWRAAVLTQQPGIISVTGHIGGTSSRLRPAALDISWTGASISDLFRLARGDDYGVRGKVAISINARTDAVEPVHGWVLNGVAEIRGLHRWDMAARPDNPSLNFTVHDAMLDPGLSDLRVPDLLIDAPHSRARARAAFAWSTEPSAGHIGDTTDFVDLTSSQIDLADALSWLRAFHPAVPDSTSLRGFVDVRAHLAGWPPAISNVWVSGERADLLASGLIGPARVGPVDLRYNRGAISLQPATLTWSAIDGRSAAFKIDASSRGRKTLFPKWQLSGTADDARGIGALAAAMGFDFSRGWNVQGPLSCDLAWQDSQYPWDSQPVGTISLGAADGKSRGAALRAPFLNLPVEQIRARIEMKPALTQIALASAKAFGATWAGTFERRPSDAEWQFALTADRLSAADLDRWLDPRWRESFLDRMLPFLGASASAASPENLRASGTLNIGEFAIDPLSIRHLAGNLRIDGRTIEFAEAKGQFYGGEAGGLFRATLSAIPHYHAEFSVSGMDPLALVAAAPALDGVSATSFEGDVSIDAHGTTRADLIASIACKGNAQADDLALHGLDVQQVSGALQPAGGAITTASAAFTCSQRAIRLQRLSLVLSGGQSFIGTGSIDFNRNLDLRFPDLGSGSPRESPSRAAGFRMTGDLSSPQITPLARVAARR